MPCAEWNNIINNQLAKEEGEKDSHKKVLSEIMRYNLAMLIYLVSGKSGLSVDKWGATNVVTLQAIQYYVGA